MATAPCVSAFLPMLAYMLKARVIRIGNVAAASHVEPISPASIDWDSVEALAR